MLNNVISIFESGAAAAATSYESIATVTVGSGGAANITFTSIPADYKHLQIRGIAKNTYVAGSYDYLLLQFNSDTGSNYNSHYLNGNGVAVATGSVVNSVNLYAGTSARSGTSDANIFSAFVIDILDYANTNKYTTVRTLAGLDKNGTGAVDFQSGAWRNVNAVTSIKLFTDPLVQHSHFALYGIKGA